MKILFLHGLGSTPGGLKPNYLKEHGHEVLNPYLPDDDFNESVGIAQAEIDQHKPDVVVGSSRGGAVAMNIISRNTPVVLLCPAWKNWGTAKTIKPNTIILHSEQDEIVPIEDSRELLENSDLPESKLIVVGQEHRLADEESLKVMLRAAVESCMPKWSDDPEELLQQNWGGLCYSAALRWITVNGHDDWHVVHGDIKRETDPKPIGHAWCENEHVVVDLTLDVGSRLIDKQTYYSVFNPEVNKNYSAFDASLLSVKNGHHGPWNEDEQLAK